MFLLIYSIKDERSFVEVQNMYEYVKMISSKAYFVLIGNKIDLAHLRTVSIEQGQNLADKYNCPFYELSVAEGYHETKQVFNDIVKYILKRKSLEESPVIKKRTGSYSSVLKGFDKQSKLSRNKDEKAEYILL